MIDQKKFSEALKEYRVRKGLTQNDLAKQLDMSRSVLSFLENGVQPPKTKHLTIIKDRLGISFDMISEDRKPGVLVRTKKPLIVWRGFFFDLV